MDTIINKKKTKKKNTYTQNRDREERNTCMINAKNCFYDERESKIKWTEFAVSVTLY